MATLKFDYTGQCAGGGHSNLRALVNGVERMTFSVLTADFIAPAAITEEQALALSGTLIKLHRRAWIKANPTGTNAQYIAALEAAEWEL